MNQIPTKEEVRDLLIENSPRGRRACERALLVLLANQTEDERRAEETKYHNHRGFMPMHARMMTSLAKQVQNSNRPKGQKLSDRQLAWLRRPNDKGVPRLGKYARQLVEAAETKAKQQG